jgi:hypothetical protein
MKKNVYAIIDTETANGLKNPLCYDVAVIVFDKKGIELFRKNWLVSNVWNNERMFKTAYYAWKRPLYDNIEKEIVNTYTFISEMNDIMNNYQVNFLLAYNLKFDLNSINKTVERFTYNSKFNTENIEYIDVWNVAIDIIMNNNSYKSFCRENGFISDAGNYKTSAEICYRFLTNIIDFDESHTAMDDCEIEKEIFMTCVKRKKKIEKGIVNNPWRKIQD